MNNNSLITIHFHQLPKRTNIIKDYQNFYSTYNSNKIQYIWKFLAKSRKIVSTIISILRPSHVTNHTIQTPRTQSCTRTYSGFNVSSWNAIRGLFRSCKSLWIGHRRGIWFQKPCKFVPPIAISSRQVGIRGMDPWEKKKKKEGGYRGGEKKKKKNSSRRNTRINECAEARRLRRQIVSRAQSTYGRDAADGTGDTRVRSSRRRKWTGRGGLVSRAPPEHRGKGGVPCDH